MGKRIDRVDTRAKLPLRRDPWWFRLAEGRYVGYRKMTKGTPGTWLARLFHDGKYHYETLGEFNDVVEKDRFDKAKEGAEQWFGVVAGSSPAAAKTTVAGACRLYIEDRRAHKGEKTARDAEGRFKRHVYDSKFGMIGLAQLKSADITAWHRGLVSTDGSDPDAERKSKDSANRDLATLRAALNFAFKQGLCASDAAWRRVEPFEKVARRRERFLKLRERQRLVKAASDEFRPFIVGLLHTACRPGELAAARAGDFDARTGSLTLEGKTGRRTIPLSSTASAFFKAQAVDKLPSAPLIAQANGSAWTTDVWAAHMRETVAKAKLPRDVSCYSLRHAAISEMIIANLDVLSVARFSGTSIQMISAAYGHLVVNHLRERLAGVTMI